SAMDDLQHAHRLSPFDTLSFKVQAAIAYAHFFVGRYDEASMAAEAALRTQPYYLTALRGAAAGHALAGRSERARTLLAQMRQVDPNLRLGDLGDLLATSPSWRSQ